MLQLNGDIRLTNDINELKQLMLTHRVVFIGEADDNLVRETNGVKASIFMPTYDMLMVENEGQTDLFYQMYIAYLGQKECTEYIALIIRLLYQGGNVVLYLSPDESQFAYSKVFLSYMNNMYGISIPTDIRIPSMFNQQYSYAVCDLLYGFDLMTIDEFFMNYPTSISATSPNIVKLIREVGHGISYNGNDVNVYIDYINRYMNIVKSNNTFIPPMIKFEK